MSRLDGHHDRRSLWTARPGRMRSVTGLAATLVITGVLAASPAIAEAQMSPHDMDQTAHFDRGYSWAVTISPLHLFLPMLEVNAEYRLANHSGVAGIVGMGASSGMGMVSLGGQYNYYLLGDFDHGMQVGGEVLMGFARLDNGTTTGTGVSLGAGPFLGYKIAASFGLTFVLQAGYHYSFAMARAEAQGQSAEAAASGAGLLLNINLGWSF